MRPTPSQFFAKTKRTPQQKERVNGLNQRVWERLSNFLLESDWSGFGLRRSASAASPWSLCSSASNRSYLVAAMRAGAIAFVLLGILALLVLL